MHDEALFLQRIQRTANALAEMHEKDTIPFEKGQDIEHVIKAFRHLKPGGTLVSVMSTSPFNVNLEKARRFREWFDGLHGVKKDLPTNSFEKSGTGVSACIIKIQKEK